MHSLLGWMLAFRDGCMLGGGMTKAVTALARTECALQLSVLFQGQGPQPCALFLPNWLLMVPRP